MVTYKSALNANLLKSCQRSKAYNQPNRPSKDLANIQISWFCSTRFQAFVVLPFTAEGLCAYMVRYPHPTKSFNHVIPSQHPLVDNKKRGQVGLVALFEFGAEIRGCLIENQHTSGHNSFWNACGFQYVLSFISKNMRVLQFFIEMEQFPQRQLFGGAISTSFPLRFQDVSKIRQVPDHQEVFVDPERDESLIIELLDMKHDVADNGSATWFLQDLASEQGAEGNIVKLLSLQSVETTFTYKK
ncbi:hypothetical protein R6Q57_019969 [Mikania cordata]